MTAVILGDLGSINRVSLRKPGHETKRSLDDLISCMHAGVDRSQGYNRAQQATGTYAVTSLEGFMGCRRDCVLQQSILEPQVERQQAANLEL